ncbi:hypothetical protein B296_00052110 [Ensete ventricosum]|uniref:Secreted protein n=1 Tax=Ensete ventricosum TaxID=4639 RepID=A0A426XGU2_ENSVE|nr:hypothetical protein B296_00052110 [Ensete ventricosum]
MSALLCLGLRLHLRSALGTTASSLTKEWAAEGNCSLGRFLLYDRSAANSSVEGRRSLLRSAIPSGESVILGVEGRRLFSLRRGTDSRARKGGGCATIRAGFIVALRSYGNSSVERATAATLVCGTLLRILCSSGMLLRWLLPSGLHWLLNSGMPLSSSHSGRGLLLSRWLLHSKRGLLLSNSHWFLPSSLG